MSAETDPVPPVPEHTPPLREDELGRLPGKFFNQAWTRWFVSLRAKINVLSETLVNLGNVSGTGIVAKDGDNWFTRTIQGVAGRTNVTSGDGVAGDPTVDVVTGDIIAGTNVSFTGSGVGRLVGSASLTINASGGGGGGGALNVVASTVVGTATANITFSSLDLDTDEIYFILLFSRPNATGNHYIRLYYNGDTTNVNYQRQVLVGNSTVASAYRDANPYIADFGTSISSTGLVSQASIIIQKQAGTIPIAFCTSNSWGVSDIVVNQTAHKWNSTSNITSLTLNNESNNFAAGTRVVLYKYALS